MKKILVTGASGFIGSFLSKKLLRSGYFVTGPIPPNPAELVGSQEFSA
ncbi:NAD-dependent epimerase/dehydratase family protein [Aerococcus urinaeequi]